MTTWADAWAYDSIWATKQFTVLDVQHMQAGFDAGSDHALVVARLDP